MDDLYRARPQRAEWFFLSVLAAFIVVATPASAFAQNKPFDGPEDYKRQVEEKCREPVRLTALASGEYELEGRTYTPEQLVEALNAKEPKPGCLQIQGERNDPVLGDRMYWLGKRLQGTILRWPPPPKALCANDATGLTSMSEEACASLPETEFAPLTPREYQDLKREHSRLSGCLLKYQVEHRGFTGSISDDRIQRRLAKEGVLPALRADAAAYFPGLAPAPPPDGKPAKGEFGELQGLSWALVYRATQKGSLVEALQARALYAKYMAMGTEGTCRPSETFTQLLEKSKPQ